MRCVIGLEIVGSQFLPGIDQPACLGLVDERCIGFITESIGNLMQHVWFGASSCAKGRIDLKYPGFGQVYAVRSGSGADERGIRAYIIAQIAAWEARSAQRAPNCTKYRHVEVIGIRGVRTGIFAGYIVVWPACLRDAYQHHRQQDAGDNNAGGDPRKQC